MNIFAYIQFFKQGPWKNLQTDLTNTFGEKKIVAYLLHGVQVPQAWSSFEE